MDKSREASMKPSYKLSVETIPVKPLRRTWPANDDDDDDEDLDATNPTHNRNMGRNQAESTKHDEKKLKPNAVPVTREATLPWLLQPQQHHDTSTNSSSDMIPSPLDLNYQALYRPRKPAGTASRKFMIPANGTAVRNRVRSPQVISRKGQLPLSLAEQPPPPPAESPYSYTSYSPSILTSDSESLPSKQTTKDLLTFHDSQSTDNKSLPTTFHDAYYTSSLTTTITSTEDKDGDFVHTKAITSSGGNNSPSNYDREENHVNDCYCIDDDHGSNFSSLTFLTNDFDEEDNEKDNEPSKHDFVPRPPARQRSMDTHRQISSLEHADANATNKLDDAVSLDSNFKIIIAQALLTKEVGRECFTWYRRWGQPNKQKMKAKLAETEKRNEKLSMTAAHIDLLPWTQNDTRLDHTVMTKLYLL